MTPKKVCVCFFLTRNPLNFLEECPSVPPLGCSPLSVCWGVSVEAVVSPTQRGRASLLLFFVFKEVLEGGAAALMGPEALGSPQICWTCFGSAWSTLCKPTDPLGN